MTETERQPSTAPQPASRVSILLVLACVGVVIGGVTYPQWKNRFVGSQDRSVTLMRPELLPEMQSVNGDSGHDHAAHGHGDSHVDGHPGHDDVTSLSLSAQAMRNIGLSSFTIRRVKPQTFRKSMSVPASVVERPGRSRVQVSTPMTGVITHVHAVQGEAVEPGTMLFQIRLTHEDLVNAQTEFVKMLGELDVEENEIARLTQVTRSGAVAGKVLLDRQYGRDKIKAHLQAQREALRLHGLSSDQIDQIASERRLLRELQIIAPAADEHDEDELKLAGNSFRTISFHDQASQPKHVHHGPLILQELSVHKGQSITAGETLCVLTDYQDLFIEGMAFEQDLPKLRKASENGWTVDARFSNQVIEDLEIAYIDNLIDPATQTLRFYVTLPNQIVKDRQTGLSRYVEWKYVPGQRLQLQVATEEWANQFVLPVDAVARQGAEYFVFLKNGDHFDRVSVHVKHKDQYNVVIDNDGAIKPGDSIAMRGAHQMHMALKNQSGPPVDPHAGHSH